MRSILPRACSLLLGLSVPLACGGTESHLFPSESGASDNPSSKDSALQSQEDPSTFPFPGAGTSDAAGPLTPGLGPASSGACNPVAATDSSASTVQHICFYAGDDQSDLAASVEQVVEVVGSGEWVHLRLTLNPNFVDNTYGANAIGWDAARGPGAAVGMQPPAAPPLAGGPGEPPAPPRDVPRPAADAGPPPPPPGDAPIPAADAGPPPPPPGDAPAMPPMPLGPGKDAAGPRTPAPPGGHTFNDLVGSDHAELELLDADGNVSMAFWLDYVSAAASAPSGYASLGVSGGEGRLSVGKPAWLLAATTSLDRNLNACGLSNFVTDSPATDENYTPNPDANTWDYRVSYEVWISTEAFGDAGFGSALIQLVHASPSKRGGATLEVVPGSCPASPDDGDAPEPLPPVLETIR